MLGCDMFNPWPAPLPPCTLLPHLPASSTPTWALPSIAFMGAYSTCYRGRRTAVSTAAPPAARIPHLLPATTPAPTHTTPLTTPAPSHTPCTHAPTLHTLPPTHSTGSPTLHRCYPTLHTTLLPRSAAAFYATRLQHRCYRAACHFLRTAPAHCSATPTHRCARFRAATPLRTTVQAGPTHALTCPTTILRSPLPLHYLPTHVVSTCYPHTTSTLRFTHPDVCRGRGGVCVCSCTPTYTLHFLHGCETGVFCTLPTHPAHCPPAPPPPHTSHPATPLPPAPTPHTCPHHPFALPYTHLLLPAATAQQRSGNSNAASATASCSRYCSSRRFRRGTPRCALDLWCFLFSPSFTVSLSFYHPRLRTHSVCCSPAWLPRPYFPRCCCLLRSAACAALSSAAFSAWLPFASFCT